MDAKRKRSRQKTRLEFEMQSRQVLYAILFVLAWTVFLGAAASLFMTTSTEDGDGALARVGVTVVLLALGAVFGVVSAYKFRAWGQEIDFHYREVTKGVITEANFVLSESILRYFFDRPTKIYTVTIEGSNLAGDKVEYTRRVPMVLWEDFYRFNVGKWVDLTYVSKK